MKSISLCVCMFLDVAINWSYARITQVNWKESVLLRNAPLKFRPLVVFAYGSLGKMSSRAGLVAQTI